MALFKNDHDLKDQLEATKAEVTEHEAVIAQRESDIINITEQMAEVSERLETRTAELAEATIENATLTGELEEAKAELVESKEAQESFEEKVPLLACKSLAFLSQSQPLQTMRPTTSTHNTQILKPPTQQPLERSGERTKPQLRLRFNHHQTTKKIIPWPTQSQASTTIS